MTYAQPLLQVDKPGFLTLFVDRGRRHHQHMGLTASGPMDEYAFLWANKLLSNTCNSPALEISFGLFTCTIKNNCMLAISGADFAATLNGKPLNNWQSFYAKTGDKLHFKGPQQQGSRAYLSTKGGFDCPLTFNSCCTVEREQLGGQHQGKKIATSETIYAYPTEKEIIRCVPHSLIPDYNNRNTIHCRFIPGYQWTAFSKKSQQAFCKQRYILSPQSNRMGCRLTGEALSVASSGIISEAIALGAIQIPPDGQPIVLMRDRQTLGGYPKIGCVISNDIEKIAQAMPGQALQFHISDIQSAYKERQLREAFFTHLQHKVL